MTRQDLGRREIDSMTQKTAIIIGAGPAGLTAAYELLTRTDVKPIVLEMSRYMGGLARTVNHNGNRIDIGGHRFFSKSDRVMQWWFGFLPPAEADAALTITYQNQTRTIDTTGAARTAGTASNTAHAVDSNQVMLVRRRKSRIYFLRRFFDYPIQLSIDTLHKLGAWRTIKIGASYARSVVAPIRPVETLEQFFINRFGHELYETFFKSYTEKVWGVPCTHISAAWGRQRIKGLSIMRTIMHALAKPFRRSGDIAQKGTETTLIEQFLYPKFGPGQMWEAVAQRVTELGGMILTDQRVEQVHAAGERVHAVTAVNTQTGESTTFEGEFVFSTMPVKDLIRAMGDLPPQDVKQVSEGLVYRDFLTVGLLLGELRVRESSRNGNRLLRDNWIYIQEPDVRLGRLQIFNNWSPHMVAEPDKVWLGLEYFCNEGDDLWTLSNEDMVALGIEELERIDIIDADEVCDSTVIRMPKAYPAYFGTYDQLGRVRAFADSFKNLYLIGRNGQHRYNNQDHSMLAAMTAVDNIAQGRTGKENVWAVNAEQEYHERK